MSSNHKAPLAAFVVVAIACAVVVLTNGVKSYARDAWQEFAAPVVSGLTLVPGLVDGGHHALTPSGEDAATDASGSAAPALAQPPAATVVAGDGRHGHAHRSHQKKKAESSTRGATVIDAPVALPTPPAPPAAAPSAPGWPGHRPSHSAGHFPQHVPGYPTGQRGHGFGFGHGLGHGTGGVRAPHGFSSPTEAHGFAPTRAHGQASHSPGHSSGHLGFGGATSHGFGSTHGHLSTSTSLGGRGHR